ncbi:MAG: alkaline phosphatase family protein [Clostridia bacterium]|nr:alkaline phosphatase family protein [Clostridia bacterium]
MPNTHSLDTLCGALAYAMGIEAPANAAKPLDALCAYVDEKLQGRKADRIFMYNPDAIAQWVYEKYPQLLSAVIKRTELECPFCTVMPSVTPVCFGTMYTGAQPAVHGIQKYDKPVIRIDTLFDALLRAGKKPVIVAYGQCSLGKIFLERDMDYFVYSNIDEVNAKAAEIILRDEYDFVVVYNGNYDSVMHKTGPESIESLGELRANAAAFAMFSEMIKTHWQGHDTLVGFAMDHGCHEIDGGCGSHGLDMEEDLNIVHRYMVHPASL